MIWRLPRASLMKAKRWPSSLWLKTELHSNSRICRGSQDDAEVGPKQSEKICLADGVGSKTGHS